MGIKAIAKLFFFAGDIKKPTDNNLEEVAVADKGVCTVQTETEGKLSKTVVNFEVEDNSYGRTLRNQLLMQNKNFVLSMYDGRKEIIGHGQRPYPRVETSFPPDRKIITFVVSLTSDRDNRAY